MRKAEKNQGSTPHNRLGSDSLDGAGQYSPKIYLAGKIRKTCWRHKLIPELRGHSWDDGPLPHYSFEYVGPFFVSCDHGCMHTESSHGNLEPLALRLCPSRNPDAEFDYSRREVFDLCLKAICEADVVICYIDTLDCFGTLIEIGFAIAHRKTLVIAFAPGIASRAKNDFWFACEAAAHVSYEVKKSELPELVRTAIRRHA